MRKNLLNSETGFGLLELLVVAGILSVSIIGLLNLFIFTSTGAELARKKTLVLGEVQSKIDEIRNYTFADISTDFASGGTMGDTFNLSSVNGMGAIYINSDNPELLYIAVSASWEDKYGRIVGEDTDLNGYLDVGEDANGNGQLNSIVEVHTQIGDR